MPKPVVDEDPGPAPAHTLPSLAEALGKPDAGLLEALLEGASDAELVKLGQDIATPRLLTDDRRLYSIAYSVWTNATAEQKDHLRGFSAELLSVAVHHAIELEAMLAEHEGRGAHAQISTATRDVSAQQAFQAGLTMRDQAEVVLRGVAGRDAATLKEIDTAMGTASPPENLAVGLSQLASIGKRFLGHKKGLVATRARVMRLDEPYLKRMTDAAAAIRATRLDASGRSAGKTVTQGSLNKKDGEAYHLLEAIIDAFEKAHDIDPTIPRLVPISMRRHFGKHARKAPAAPPAPPVA
jgi:hypothetical protein